jgi:hypothetical protein
MNEEILDKIRPSEEEVIKNKLRSIKYCVVLVWVTINLRNFGVVHAPELAMYMRMETANAIKVLRMLENLRMLKSKNIGNIIEFTPVYEENDKKMVIENYFDYATERLNAFGVL